MLSTSACVLALIGTSAAFAPQAIYLPRAVSALPRTAAQFGRRAEYRTAPQRHVINTFTMSAQSIPARQAGLTAALSELGGALIKIVGKFSTKRYVRHVVQSHHRPRAHRKHR